MFEYIVENFQFIIDFTDKSLQGGNKPIYKIKSIKFFLQLFALIGCTLNNQISTMPCYKKKNK